MHLCSEIPAFEPTQCPQSARCLKLPLPRISLGSCSHFLPLPLLPFLPSEQGAVCAGRCGTRDGAPRGWVLSGLLLSYSQWWLESESHFSFSDNTSAGPALETNVQGASLLPRTVPGRGPRHWPYVTLLLPVPVPHVFWTHLSPLLSDTPLSSHLSHSVGGSVEALMSFSHKILCGLRSCWASAAARCVMDLKLGNSWE